MRNPTWLGSLLVAALAGCGGSSGTTTYVYHGNPTPWSGGAAPIAGATLYGIQSGASTVVSPGTQAGYGITATSAGGAGAAYRLVWTGDAQTTNALREFWGSVWTGGTFTAVTPGCADNLCALEAGDVVTAPVNENGGGQRIDFDTFAADGLDGFDFQVDNEPVYFDFYIDGEHHPELVFFPATDNGGAVSNVGVIPFALTTH
jgi:hypothetical protein